MFALLIAGLILLAELLIISVIYKDLVVFSCSSTGLTTLCLKISELPLRALGLLGVACVIGLARPSFFAELWSARTGDLQKNWIGVHIVGVLTLLAPVFILNDGISSTTFLGVIALWIIGATLSSLGAIFTFFAPDRLWGRLKVAHPALLGSLALGFLIPEIGRVAQFIWQWDFLRSITFDASRSLLSLFWTEVVAVPELHHLGVGDFLVLVGEQCSGIEGLALITLFFTIYVTLFRDELYLSRVWILLPIGLLLSWCANIIRIVALISIGGLYSPEHAINGFHSHAGWFFFSILSLGIAVAAHQIKWFRREPATSSGQGIQNRAEPLPFWDDPIVFQILPFMVFMGASLIVSTFAENTNLWYPAKFVAMAAILFAFRDQLRALAWRIDPLAIGAGVIIAIIWLAAYPAEAPDGPTIAEQLPLAVFFIWVITRVLGTTLLVPVIEELFFRGYLLDKFRSGATWMTILGVIVTSALFAMMHQKWEMAFVAGIVFAGLTLRKNGRITDAILSHAVANGLIAGWALATSQWSVL